MSLAFLYPLCWLGALAIAAPIWLHLRRKFDANVLDFPALRFLDDQPEPRLSPLGGSGERHLRGVPTTLPPKRETAREGRFSSA